MTLSRSTASTLSASKSRNAALQKLLKPKLSKQRMLRLNLGCLIRTSRSSSWLKRVNVLKT